MKKRALLPAIALLLPLHAQDDADLAQQLTNPLADLISMPIQGNMDFGVGPGGGHRVFTNIQPVIPFSLNENWNLISRTVLPVVDQNGIDFAGDRSDAFGLGDTVQSFFFSPKQTEPFIWGIGPVFLLPTATNGSLGAEKWGAGPTGVILKIDGPWTYGVLVNHLWDVTDQRGAGNTYIPLPGGGVASLSNDINLTLVQPFLSYTTDTATTFTINSESTYNWTSHQWTVPINLQVSQLIKPGKVPISVYAGVRYYVERPAQGPEWGFRLGCTLLFPKG
jgi:hypothetical protein